MPYQNEHAARINPAEKYKEFRRVNDKFAPGIDVVFGILPDGGTEIHAIHFKADKFTEAPARKWLKDNDFKPIAFEPAEPKQEHAKLETVDLLGEEVFSAGKWTATNGKARAYSVDDLKNMADAANETTYRNKPLKLGHNNEQKALKDAGYFGDGAPAAGWMKNFRVQGEKLIADFTQVPKVIADLIKGGAYKQKSLEIWDDFKDEALNKVYKMMPCAVALLGTELPAVSNLNSLTALYSICESSPATQFLFQVADAQTDKPENKDGDNMTPEEIKALQDENASMKDECKKLNSKVADLEKANHAKAEEDAAKDKTIADLEKDKADLGTALHAKNETADATVKSLTERVESLTSQIVEFSKTAADAKAAEREAFLSTHADKLTPLQRIAYSRTLEAAATAPEFYKFSKGDGSGELTGEAAVRAEIETLPTNPLLVEHGKTEEKRTAADASAKITAYCKANGLDEKKSDDYRTAVKATM
jgi:hypothetical protein